MKHCLKTQVIRQWKGFEGEVRTRWSKLTTRDFERIAGRQDKLAALIQERYGFPQEEAQRQVNEWAAHLK